MQAQRHPADKGPEDKLLRSPLKWALLALVIERPGHAYDLAQRFERRYGEILPLTSSRSVYRAIRDLDERGLIKRIPPADAEAPQAGREPSRAKTEYEATDKGLEEYRARLMSQICEDRHRRELFILALSALSRQPEQMIDVVCDYEREWVAQGMRATVAHDEEGEPEWLPALLAKLLYEENRLTVDAKLKWVQYARAQLDELARERRQR